MPALRLCGGEKANGVRHAEYGFCRVELFYSVDRIYFMAFMERQNAVKGEKLRKRGADRRDCIRCKLRFDVRGVLFVGFRGTYGD